MLTVLRIKNLALVADLTIEFQPGYNVVTGETGAGKSILIGALNLVLGERAERSLIRSGSDGCAVEAVFDVTHLHAPLAAFLEESGLEPCEDCQLVVKRTLTSAGANRQFVNGSATTLNVLASLGQWLVDIHGPHEHQSLLDPSSQLAILDAFGKLEPARTTFAALARRRAALESEKADLIVDERTYAQQLDLLRFQVNEIKAAQLKADEEAQVEQEHRRASNAARLLQLSRAALDLLSENENSLLTQAGVITRTLQELQRVDSTAGALLAVQEQGISALNELRSELSRYSEKTEVEPARLQQLEERLDLLHSLKRKYGATVPEVIAFGEDAGRKLHSLEQRDAEVARLNAELQKTDAELLHAGRALSRQRRRIIPGLSQAVSRQLAELGFKQSRFDVALSTQEPGPETSSSKPQTSKAEGAVGGSGFHDSRFTFHSAGFDTAEFQFAPNPGEPARPLRAIASSGELARVMLALKTVLAAEDQIPVLVFDEVDANVGGETAHAVGEKMRQIARKRQVLCITHLAPVAAPASAHFVAVKQLKAGRTVSEIKLLPPKERAAELARMLGGQSEAARKHAEALLQATAEK